MDDFEFMNTSERAKLKLIQSSLQTWVVYGLELHST